MLTETKLVLSRHLFEAVKLSPERGYIIAQRAGISSSLLSRLLHGAERIRPQDPRVLAIAQVVGIPPERAFTRASSEDKRLERRNRRG